MHEDLKKLLDTLEEEMKAKQLWSSSKPTLEALQSRQPFCVDTLAFEEWVQFIMLPTFRGMIQADQPLPSACDISPMAEEVWKDRSVESVIELIRCIDQLLTQTH